MVDAPSEPAGPARVTTPEKLPSSALDVIRSRASLPRSALGSVRAGALTATAKPVPGSPASENASFPIMPSTVPKGAPPTLRLAVTATPGSLQSSCSGSA